MEEDLPRMNAAVLHLSRVYSGAIYLEIRPALLALGLSLWSRSFRFDRQQFHLSSLLVLRAVSRLPSDAAPLDALVPCALKQISAFDSMGIRYFRISHFLKIHFSLYAVQNIPGTILRAG